MAHVRFAAYRRRFVRRFLWAAIPWGLFLVLASSARSGFNPIDAAFALVLGGAMYGAATTLLTALYPDGKPTVVQPPNGLTPSDALVSPVATVQTAQSPAKGHTPASRVRMGAITALLCAALGAATWTAMRPDSIGPPTRTEQDDREYEAETLTEVLASSEDGSPTVEWVDPEYRAAYASGAVAADAGLRCSQFAMIPDTIDLEEIRVVFPDGDRLCSEVYTRPSYDADPAEVREHDGPIIGLEMRPLLEQWNRLASPVVTDLQDQNVGAERWVASTRSVLPELEEVVAGLEAATLRILDGSIRTNLELINMGYREKLEALTAIVDAIASGDEEAARSALFDLQYAAGESQRQAEQFAQIAQQVGAQQ